MTQHTRASRIQLCLVGLLALITACGNRDDTTAPLGTGNLVLTLTTRDGVTPSIVLTGPNGYSRTVSSSMTIGQLEAGSYTIAADSIVTQGALVGYSVDTAVITGSPIMVSETGSSSATVTYAFARTHGAMWVASTYGPHPSGLAPSQLETTAVIGAADTIGGMPSSIGLAIDADGNMWVSQRASGTLRMYTLAQRESNASPTPARTLSSPALSHPGKINFDSHGTLWVTDYYNGLVGFSSTQLAAGGSAVTPFVNVTDDASDAAGASSVVFDAVGNAWISETETGNLVMYTPAMLTSSGATPPAVRIGGTGALDRSVREGGIAKAGAFGFVGPNLSTPYGLAFDSHGNLWVANYGDSRITAYASSQLSVSGDPVPSITLTGAIDYPDALAFDRAGNLWVSDDDYYTVTRFNASLLAASGVVAGSVVLASEDFGDPFQIVFDDEVVTPPPPIVQQTSRTHYEHAATRIRNALRRQN
jgi:sugar lactone lactonase YvrE